MPEALDRPVRLRCPACSSPIEDRRSGTIVCPGCGNIFPVLDGIPSFMPAAVEDERVKDFFDGVATTLDRDKLSYVPFAAPELDRQLTLLSHAFLRAVDRWIPRGSRILDVGVGHGALLEPAVHTYDMTGVDVAFHMLPLARDRGYRVYQADAAALPFADAEFDAVVCAEVLQHFADPRPILSDLMRTCRPGGSIVLSTLNKQSIARFLRRAMTKLSPPQSLPLPIIRRSAGDLVRAASQYKVDLLEAAWLLSPLDAVAFTKSERAPLAPFATNFILNLRKRAD